MQFIATRPVKTVNVYCSVTLKIRYLQPQVLELNSYNIQYLITLVNGIYTRKKLQVVQYNFSYG